MQLVHVNSLVMHPKSPILMIFFRALILSLAKVNDTWHFKIFHPDGNWSCATSILQMKSQCYDACARIYCIIEEFLDLQDTALNVQVCPGSYSTYSCMTCCNWSGSNVWSYALLCPTGLDVGVTSYVDMAMWSSIAARPGDLSQDQASVMRYN